MPVDPEVRIGRLDNGMTYYLRHNSKPAGLAEFFIVHNVGAIQEEDSQAGLAHFLEHLAFNGTDNMPGKTTINWLAAIGAKNYNAMTRVEDTQYMLTQVPLKRESIIDSALLILHDWSSFVTLKDEEIDNERGVIIEELRGIENANRRLMNLWRPVMYGGTRYGDRDGIGTEEQLRTFPYKEIRDFYKKWYRPDLQAVVIVGDFDVDQMEAKVRKVMGSIPAAVNPAPKEYFPIPDNEEPVGIVLSDPELTGSNVSFYIRHPETPFEQRDDIATVQFNLAMNAAMSMANVRLGDVARRVDAPFLGSIMAWDGMSETNKSLTLGTSAPENQLPSAFEAAVTEMERIRRYGFTPGELERYKASALNGLEVNFERRADRESRSFVNDYVANFTDNAPIPSAEDNYAIRKKMLEELTLEEVNNAVRSVMTEKNNLVIALTPEKQGVTVPTLEELFAVLKRVRNAEIAPYEDVDTNQPLISGKIKAGKVVKEEGGVFGSTVWTLRNGVRVVLRPSKMSANSISFGMNAQGGMSLVGDEDYRTAMALTEVVGMSGIGKFDNTTKNKMLMGKTVSMGPSIGRFTSSLNGASTLKDAETMFQLAYLYFTEPRISKDEFDRFMKNCRGSLQNAKDTPRYIFTDQLNRVMYGEGVRAQQLSLENIDEIDFDRMPTLWNKFFGKTADSYTVYLVGDFDPQEIKPLVEKYIGGLPSGAPKLKWQDDGLTRRKGRIEERFEVPMQTPKSTAYFTWEGDIDYTLENDRTMNALVTCLYNRYFDAVREERGGTYAVPVGGTVSMLPKGEYELKVQFDTDPAMVEDLAKIIEAVLRNIADHGPRESDMAQILEFWRKERAQQLERNAFWRSSLVEYYDRGQDRVTPYDEVIEGITGEKVQQLARKIIADGNMIRLVMAPRQ